jgi:hypothetical protein
MLGGSRPDQQTRILTCTRVTVVFRPSGVFGGNPLQDCRTFPGRAAALPGKCSRFLPKTPFGPESHGYDFWEFQKREFASGGLVIRVMHRTHSSQVVWTNCPEHVRVRQTMPPPTLGPSARRHVHRGSVPPKRHVPANFLQIPFNMAPSITSND